MAAGTIAIELYQVSRGNENKAILSGSLKANPNTAEFENITVENVSSIAACGRNPVLRVGEENCLSLGREAYVLLSHHGEKQREIRIVE